MYSMMSGNKLFFLVMTILSVGSCSGSGTGAGRPLPYGTAPQEYEGYELVWSDEFDSPGRPAAHWSYESGFVRNGELQWYRPENAEVRGGCLVITARAETVPNPWYDSLSTDWRKNRRRAEFTSACVTTSGSFSFRYGRLEVRARIPVAQGAWPAIWTLGQDVPWPDGGEVDVMEFYRRDGYPEIMANACWPASPRDTVPEDAPGTAMTVASDFVTPDGTVRWDETKTPLSYFTGRNSRWAGEFHLWRMDWDPGYIRIYLDGELLNEINLRKADMAGTASGGEPFNPFSNGREGSGHYILLNLAIGANGGEPDLASFPLEYEVDFVRVYRAAPAEAE